MPVSTDEPIIAVCCQGADVLALHSVATGEEIGQISVGGHPVHATVVGDRVVVATMNERSVTVIDETGELIPIDIGVLGPSHFATVGSMLFVTCTAGDVVAVIDPIEQTLQERIAVGAEPHELAVGEDFVYVGSRRDGDISVIEPDRREVIGQLVVEGDARIEGIEMSLVAGRGYAVDRTGKRVIAFSLEPSPTIIGEASVGADPYELTVFDDAIVVPGPGSGEIHEFDRELCQRDVHHGFERPVDVVEFAGERWVIDRSATVLRSLSGRAIEIPAGAIAARPNPTGVILSHYDDAAISLVHPDYGVRWHQSTGEYPFGSLTI